MKKILIVIANGDIGKGGGSNVAMHNLLQTLVKKKDLQLHVVFNCGSEGTFSQWLVKNNIPYTTIYGIHMHTWPKVKSLRDIALLPYRLLRQWIMSVISVHMLRNVIRNFQPDLVHVNNSVYYFAVKAAEKENVPVLWHIREYCNLIFNMFPSKSVFAHKLQSRTTVSITNGVANHVGCFNNSGHYVLYDGVMHNDEIVYNEDKKDYFLFTGQISENKGVTDLIQAFIVYAKNNPNGNLFIAGRGDCKYIQELNDMICSEGLSERVKFLGFRSDRYQLMQHARAAIVSSHWEGFGFVTIEAMMNGCLVIGHNVGGTKMIMEHVENNALSYDTVQELAKRMEEVMNHPASYYKPMILKAQEIVARDYSIEKAGEDLYKLYNNLIK